MSSEKENRSPIERRIQQYTDGPAVLLAPGEGPSIERSSSSRFCHLASGPDFLLRLNRHSRRRLSWVRGGSGDSQAADLNPFPLFYPIRGRLSIRPRSEEKPAKALRRPDGARLDETLCPLRPGGSRRIICAIISEYPATIFHGSIRGFSTWSFLYRKYLLSTRDRRRPPASSSF